MVVAFERQETGSCSAVDVLSAVDVGGMNLLLRAAYKGNIEKFQQCWRLCCTDFAAINFRDYSKRTALMHACISGCRPIVQLLIESKMVAIDAQDLSGFTALMYAAQRGHQCIVELLLEAKANHKLTDRRGNTAIILAARRNQVACLEVLARYIKDPADWKEQGEHGLTAEQWAETNQRQAAAEFLSRLRNCFEN